MEWLLLGFVAGGICGFVLFAMMSMALRNDETEARAMATLDRRAALKGRAPTT